MKTLLRFSDAQVLYSHPLQQGLKHLYEQSQERAETEFFTHIHYNKDWNKIGKNIETSFPFVLYSHPLQQGLKRSNWLDGFQLWNGSLLTSITTRIETSLYSFLKTNIEKVLYSHPLQQGLKPHCGISINRRANSSLLTSITTRIETEL